jgi:hypothetical protein
VAYDALPDGWQVWTDEDGGRSVLVFRPDIFDADAFPAACLPTIYVTDGPGDRRPGAHATGCWRAKLVLEPEITVTESAPADSKAAAASDAVTIAERFVAGAFDLEGAYYDPSDRTAYLDRLADCIE